MHPEINSWMFGSCFKAGIHIEYRALALLKTWKELLIAPKWGCTIM